MKQVRVITNIVFAVVFLSFYEARPQDPNTMQRLSPDDAYEILEKLNSQGELLPPVSAYSYGKQRLKDLYAVNCFGIKLPNGNRVVGESRGESYGLSLTDPTGSWATMIGVLYLETNLIYENQLIPKGPYVTLLATDKLRLLSSESEIKISISKFHDFPLTSEIDRLILESKKTLPTFSLSYEDNNVAITMENNTIALILEDKVSVEELSNPSLLADIAKNTMYAGRGQDAVKNIEDQDLLADIAKNAFTRAARKTAVEKLTDPAILADIADSDIDHTVRMTAYSMLKEVLKSLIDSGDEYFSQNQYDAAISYYSKTIDIFTKIVYRKSSNIQIDPASVQMAIETCYRRGDCYNKMGLRQEATKDSTLAREFERVINK